MSVIDKYTVSSIAIAIAVASILFALDRYIIPVSNAVNAVLPPIWLPFRGALAEIILKDRLQYCEDVIMDHEHGMAIISCDPGRAQWNTVMGPMYDPNPRGDIYVYDYATKKSLRKLKLVGFPTTADFHPLGINFFRSQGGALTRLFVVNHQRNGSTIDIFDLHYAELQLTFIMSICDHDHNILSPNAVAPTSYTSFYVTNDHRFIPRLHHNLNIQETMRGLPLGWATFVEFGMERPKFSTAATGIPFANGIVVTPTGREVIIASSTGRELYVYDRDPETNILSPCLERIPMVFAPDNLNFDCSLDVGDRTVFDSDGRFLRGLICAGHPSVPELMAMSRDPITHRAPSWVAEVRRGQGDDPAPCHAMPLSRKGPYYLSTLYQSDGSHYPSSTTGAMDFKRRRLIVCGLYAEGILDIAWEDIGT